MRHRIVNITFFTIAITLALLSLFAYLSWWFLGLALVIWLGIVIVGSAWIGSNYHVKAHCSNPSETQNKIAITFDDGPSEFTPKILDLLQKHNATASFFCIGKNIVAHPDILLQTFENGHIIGNHSYYHAKNFDWKNKQHVVLELENTDEAIFSIISKKPKFFRPPYGVTNPAIANAVSQTKHHVIGWNIRSMDGISNDEQSIFGRVIKQLRPGAIILMHDTSQASVNVLERILLTLREKKFEVVPLDELLALQAYEKD